MICTKFYIIYFYLHIKTVKKERQISVTGMVFFMNSSDNYTISHLHFFFFFVKYLKFPPADLIGNPGQSLLSFIGRLNGEDYKDPKEDSTNNDRSLCS